MFGGNPHQSRNPQWSTGGQQDESQQLPTQPSPSNSGIIPGTPSFYDPNAAGQQPQSSLDDHQWLRSTTAQQYVSGLGTGAYSIPYQQQQPQSSRALLHEPFLRPRQRTAAQPQQLSQGQQQAAPPLLNRYNFVAPQYQPPQQSQFSLDQSAAPGYRAQVLNESYPYGQVSSNPANPGQNASGVENYPYSQQFQFFNSPLSELANNTTPSSSSSELLAYPPPHGPSVSPAVSDRSSQQNTSGLTPPPPLPSSASVAKPVVAAAESSTAQTKAVRSNKKRKGVKRPRIDDDSTTDTDEDEVLGSVGNFSIHLTRPPRGSEFNFPTRL
ncbi:hypothetical protein BDM02DRAFT_3182755 [Thelephora ganbajun]|uniref:Uncharacterized protein n=1 Tax=Thelephora ganbajun TaxID=370292 RepID=A0ACB6ZVZ9_THEGA|nr:hypothetical protein BDM02DRAFT_3182755 [Thelephora ganbajun]